MNIAIFTNTFTPHVGGVARSVEAFVAEYRKLGHRVLVVAPEFANMPEHETDVFRVAAIQNFNASDFSVALPFVDQLSEVLDEFSPDIIHYGASCHGACGHRIAYCFCLVFAWSVFILVS